MSITHAAVALLFAILPTRGYFRPNHPIDIRFVTSRSQFDQESINIGLRTAEMLGKFNAAPIDMVVSAHGQPFFHVYTLSGRLLQSHPTAMAKVHGDIADITQYYPQVTKTGTYVITWKTSQPLVLETLNNPGFPSAALKNISPQELVNIPASQKASFLQQFKPTVYHIVPLQYARIKTASGIILLKFWYDMAPHTVANFIRLAQQRFYDGSNFHRIIKGFMIQGGDSLCNIAGRAGTGGPGYEIVQEFNPRPMDRGVLAMARAQSHDSAGSQFFILQDNTPQLNGHYTGFGQVFKGLKVVDDIADKTPVSDNNGTVAGPKPKIITVKILPATLAMYGIKAKK